MSVSELAFLHERPRSPRRPAGCEQPLVHIGVDLISELVQDAGMNVPVWQGGCYLLATPSWTGHRINHLGVARDASERLQMTYHEAGHMIDLHPPSVTKMKGPLDAFIRAIEGS